MAIQTINYANIPAQGDPMLDAIVPGLTQGLKLAYAPKQMNADLKTAQLKQALDRIKLKYAEPEAQSDLAYKQALTGMTNQKSKFMPLDELTRSLNTQRTNSRFDQSYKLSKMLSNLSPAARASWIDANKEAYTNAIDSMANEVNQPKDNSQELLKQLLSKIFGEKGQQIQPGSQFKMAPELTPQQVNASPLTIKDNQAQALADSGIAKSSFMTLPENVDKIGLASEMEANKSLVTPATRRQAEAAESFDNFLKNNQQDYAESIKNISQYAGLIGKGQLGLDKLKTENPQALQDYQWFSGQFVPQMENVVTQMEGSSIAPAKQHEIRNTFESGVKSLSTDPKSSINYFNRLIKMLSGISKERQNTAQPLFKGTYEKATGAAGIPSPYVKTQSSSNDFSQEDIEFTAKKHGMTVDQVKQKLGIS